MCGPIDGSQPSYCQTEGQVHNVFMNQPEVPFNRLELNRETVLVIKGDTLVPGDALLEEDGDAVEIRPVISGGALGPRRTEP